MKLNLFFSLFLLVILSLSVASCKKDIAGANNNNGNTDSTAAPTVYVAGCIGDTAVYWKNGVVNNLSDGNKASVARSIFISGNDVYAAGYIGDTAVYWKNGVVTYLKNNEGTAGAMSIFVSGNDVYVAGNEKMSSDYTVATLWKNGTPTYFPNTIYGEGTYSSSWVNAVYVSGSDVYMCGYQTDAIAVGVQFVAVYWKNGVLSTLPYTTNNSYGADGIYVSDNNVYAAGSGTVTAGNTVPLYWANGQPATVKDTTLQSYAVAVYVSGNDVYLVGSQALPGDDERATYWKNGVATNTTIVGYWDISQGLGLAVYGSDVYVSGFEGSPSGYVAAYWKNGAQVILSTNQSSYGYSIAVK